MKINLNHLATKITLKEGKKESVSIGQVKEVMKLLFIELAGMTEGEVNNILKKYRKKYKIIKRKNGNNKK